VTRVRFAVPTLRALALTLAAALCFLSTSCGGSDARPTAEAPCEQAHNSNRAAECGFVPTASLTPATREIGAPETLRRQPCGTITEAVFYAASDWEDLGERLAAAGFPCATYQISIPPVQAKDGTWTQPRKDEARRIHALGPQFHALAEIRVDAWGPWLEAHPGKTWYDAGQEAARRMRGAGYDPRHGETWAINEFMLPVLTDLDARRGMRDFARGLYEGSGHAQGLVFAVVPFQDASDVSGYKKQLKSWLEDGSFWTDMERYVAVWADEVYVDAESCCVAGASITARAPRLNEYLQHRLTLAEAGPASAGAARRFLTDAYLPLGNAAWQWSFGFGDTSIGLVQMQRLVSDQVFAMRLFSASRTSREAQSRIGFAWAPRSATGRMTPGFALETERLLVRLSAAIHDSARTRSPAGACGAGGESRWCDCDVAGAEFEDAWASFTRWD
jgi:hypothetical protein